ncbi:MAG: DUF3892 domain-containing protein [Candidatus Thiodiazotropha weberae]|nr:DUF3892 domain-containing protein [Candidatus Thiodiazotropha lotti]MCG8010106.1 DUF3892 domain-containing protein [Candidatus Thiodiazotropha lotti]MCW4209564.1 DUF3892 domain-containing protein [Candidatus Thiodiazotropha lotti]MCW4216747.1 DUF3892 domain-containing protein [Candidatus Thiodiazotropha lotti]
MTNRAVTRSGKDIEGDITSLCNPSELWSPRKKADAIHDIETGIHQYHVPWSDGTKTPIRVVDGPNGKYLRTDRDNTTRNNLDDLPNC